MKKLLEIKKIKKAQKPRFLRRNFMKNKRSRVNDAWRAPRGLHNKLRRRRRGVGQWVMPGYKMPCAVRGLTVQGLEPVVVENVAQVSALDASKHSAILKGSAGKKNRIAMVTEALKKKISILNMKNPEAFLKQCEEQKKQKKTEKKEPQEQKVVESTKKESESIEDLAEGKKDKKKETVKQMNKILTKKE
jgi:large subunit ribosomal protein L32e